MNNKLLVISLSGLKAFRKLICLNYDDGYEALTLMYLQLYIEQPDCYAGCFFDAIGKLNKLKEKGNKKGCKVENDVLIKYIHDADIYIGKYNETWLDAAQRYQKIYQQLELQDGAYYSLIIGSKISSETLLKWEESYHKIPNDLFRLLNEHGSFKVRQFEARCSVSIYSDGFKGLADVVSDNYYYLLTEFSEVQISLLNEHLFIFGETLYSSEEDAEVRFYYFTKEGHIGWIHHNEVRSDFYEQVFDFFFANNIEFFFQNESFKVNFSSNEEYQEFINNMLETSEKTEYFSLDKLLSNEINEAIKLLVSESISDDAELNKLLIYLGYQSI